MTICNYCPTNCYCFTSVTLLQMTEYRLQPLQNIDRCRELLSACTALELHCTTVNCVILSSLKYQLVEKVVCREVITQNYLLSQFPERDVVGIVFKNAALDGSNGDPKSDYRKSSRNLIKSTSNKSNKLMNPYVIRINDQKTQLKCQLI